MTIYTRTGDKGDTMMYGGKTAAKSDPRIGAYGNLDELSSYLGLVLCHINKSGDKSLITAIQKDLYLLMGYLAGAPTALDFIDGEIQSFEQIIDKEEALLSPLTSFILPQGTAAAAHLHVARTVCRRAERHIVRLAKHNHTAYAPVIKYLNRLSDLLFILARKYNTNEVVITNL